MWHPPGLPHCRTWNRPLAILWPQLPHLRDGSFTVQKPHSLIISALSSHLCHLHTPWSKGEGLGISIFCLMGHQVWEPSLISWVNGFQRGENELPFPLPSLVLFFLPLLPSYPFLFSLPLPPFLSPSPPILPFIVPIPSLIHSFFPSSIHPVN